MAALSENKKDRVTIRKKDSADDSILPVVRKFLWLAAIGTVAWYTTSLWGVQMREQLGRWWYSLMALIAG